MGKNASCQPALSIAYLHCSACSKSEDQHGMLALICWQLNGSAMLQVGERRLYEEPLQPGLCLCLHRSSLRLSRISLCIITPYCGH